MFPSTQHNRVTCSARLWRAVRRTPWYSLWSAGFCWIAGSLQDPQGCSEPILHELRMPLRRDRKVLPVGSVLRHPLVLDRRLIRGTIQAVRTQGDEDRMGIPCARLSKANVTRVWPVLCATTAAVPTNASLPG